MSVNADVFRQDIGIGEPRLLSLLCSMKSGLGGGNAALCERYFLCFPMFQPPVGVLLAVSGIPGPSCHPPGPVSEYLGQDTPLKNS